jgi:hypothetical protein
MDKKPAVMVFITVNFDKVIPPAQVTGADPAANINAD